MCLETIAEKLIDVFCCFYIGSLQCCRDCFCGSLSGCRHVRGSIGVQQWARARRKHHACAEKFRKHMIGENTIFRIVPTRIPPGTGFSNPNAKGPETLTGPQSPAPLGHGLAPPLPACCPTLWHGISAALACGMA